MKYEEVMKLLDAGYTRDEILNMDTETPDEIPPEEKTPSEAPKENEVSEMMKEMKEMFTEMRKEFTAWNIMNSSQPTKEERTSEDIIANIINPNMIKKGDK